MAGVRYISRPSVTNGSRWAAAANISSGIAVIGPESTVSAMCPPPWLVNCPCPVSWIAAM